jgi:SAM-dependent methyltransferase
MRRTVLLPVASMLHRFGHSVSRRLRLRRPGTREIATAASKPDRLSDEQFVDAAYRVLLGRAPDDEGRNHQLALLRGGLSRRGLVARLRASEEYQKLVAPGPLEVLHTSRVQWTRALPPAGTIVDLGGASTTSGIGAMLQLGYPYRFESLTIIDLPPEERHEEFVSERYPDRVDSPLGPVFHQHASMTDLSSIPDGSVDLVNSGQTFEHIHPAEGELVLKEVRRVLKPTGALALDTPNRALTALQMRDEVEEFINPDHEVEYTHEQMVDLFDRYGFMVERAQGMVFMPESVANDAFDVDEMVRNPGLYDDIDKCYLLAYLVRPRP